jgi:7-keto-8-aminopelargonate synthetase-like enzyme
MKGTQRCHKATNSATMINGFRRARPDYDYFAHHHASRLKYLFARKREFRATCQNLVSIRKDRGQEPY